MPNYSEAELRNLHVVRQFLNEEPPPDDKSLLFAEDGVWWNGLALIHPDGGTEHRGREAIRRLLPSQHAGTKLLPGRDRYDMSTAEIADVVHPCRRRLRRPPADLPCDHAARSDVREHVLLRVPIQRRG